MSRPKKPLEYWLSRSGVKTLLWLLGRLPDGAVLPLGKSLGALAYAAASRPRREAHKNLRRAFGPAPSPQEIERLARGNFRHLGQSLTEFLRMAYWDPADIERRVELRGIDHLEAALAAGRGVICVTAHYGNWELLAARLVGAGYPLTVIARTADDPAIEALTHQIRSRSGYRVIHRSSRQALRPLLECLQRNELLGILLDRNTKEGRGEAFVEFFGYPAATATGPAVLARRTGARLVPVFDRRLADGRHAAEFQPALEWEATAEPERDIWEISARLTRAIEMQVRADPEQWFWIYNRWKRQPPPGVHPPLSQRSLKPVPSQRTPDGDSAPVKEETVGVPS